MYRPLLLLMAGQEQAAWQQAKSEISHSPPPPDLVVNIVEMYSHETGRHKEARHLDAAARAKPRAFAAKH